MYIRRVAGYPKEAEADYPNSANPLIKDLTALYSNNTYLATLSAAARDRVIIDSVTYHPYVPGLGNAMGLVSYPGLAGYSAGTDCVGFTQRSASYTGSQYRWVTLGPIAGDPRVRNLTDELGAGAQYWGGTRQLTWYPKANAGNNTGSIEIASKANPQIYFDESGNPVEYWPTFEEISPGDIMYYTKNGIAAHIALVQNVSDTNGDGKIELDEISLIESTFDGSDPTNIIGNVLQQRTLQFYQSSNKSWIMVRLK